MNRLYLIHSTWVTDGDTFDKYNMAIGEEEYKEALQALLEDDVEDDLVVNIRRIKLPSTKDIRD